MTITPITIRDARTADLEGLMAIRYADHPDIHRDRLRDAATNHLHYLVAECAGTTVGFGLLVLSRPATWLDGGTTDRLPQIVDLYVSEAQRGKDIGTSIVQHVDEISVSAGHDELYLCVDPTDSTGAFALYARLGYQALQAQPYRDQWRFSDSDAHVHVGESWAVDIVKALM